MTPEQIPHAVQPLHDRIIVKRIQSLATLESKLIILVRENPELLDFVGDGNNGHNNDNRRVALMSQVIAVGAGVRGVKKGDIIAHTAWNDFPQLFEIPKEYALITEGDVMGHLTVNTPDA